VEWGKRPASFPGQEATFRLISRFTFSLSQIWIKVWYAMPFSAAIFQASISNADREAWLMRFFGNLRLVISSFSSISSVSAKKSVLSWIDQKSNSAFSFFNTGIFCRRWLFS
jgi:hypothetical protein